MKIVERVTVTHRKGASSKDQEGDGPGGQDRRAASRAMQLHKQIHSAQVLWKASRALMERLQGLPESGNRFGVVLASEGLNSDSHAVAREEYLARMEAGPQEEHDVLFVMLCNYPEGSDLRALGDVWKARGSHINLYGSTIDDALPVAQLLLEHGCVDRLLVGAVKGLDGQELSAELALVEGAATAAPKEKAYLGATTLAAPSKDDSATSLAQRTLEGFLEQHPVDPKNTVLVFSTFLGSLVERGYRELLRQEPPGDYRSTLEKLATRLGFERTLFPCGYVGAGVSALLLGRILLGLGDAERVLICSADVFQGGVDHALYLTACEDRPHFGQGCACLLLERNGDPSRELGVVPFAPKIRERKSIDLAFGEAPLAALKMKPCARRIVSGCTALDLRAGEQVAERFWPGQSAETNVQGRMFATDVPALLTRAEGSVAIVSANVMGGGGIVTLG